LCGAPHFKTPVSTPAILQKRSIWVQFPYIQGLIAQLQASMERWGLGANLIACPDHIQMVCYRVIPLAAGTDGRNQAERQSHPKENEPWKARKYWAWR